MQAAIDIAERHQTPFGAVLSMGDEIFVEAANQTRQLHDPTAHAEVMALRKLGEHLKKTDFSGFTLYTTCEPCPMCTSAAIWAKVDTIVYGAGIPAITEFIFSGFTLYTTCEPCPMCTSAAIWAKVDTIVYGAGIPAITEFMPQISLRAKTVCEHSFKQVNVIHGFMEQECAQLLQKFG